MVHYQTTFIGLVAMDFELRCSIRLLELLNNVVLSDTCFRMGCSGSKTAGSPMMRMLEYERMAKETEL